MKNIQDIVNAGGHDIELPFGEFKGTLIINKPCTLKGNSTTIWNNDNSVIEIRSQGVKLCNIRVEMTDSKSDFCCIRSYYPDTLFENVEISGNVKGVKNEELQWIIPRSIQLGEFKSESINTFKMEIYVPTETRISTNISALKISPSVLKKGRNIITLETDEINHKIFIYGEILLQSKFTRRIYISGKSFIDAPVRQNYNVYTAEEPDSDKNIETNFNHLQIPSENSEKYPSRQNKNNENSLRMKRLRKGERVYIDDIADDIIKIEFNCRKMLAPLDIDPYVFLLNRDGMAFNDSNFVFFNNPVSENNEVRIQPSSSGKVSDIDIDLRLVPSYIEKISVTYSIYINNARDNFSKVADPFVSIRSKENIKYFFAAEDLMMETTIIFLEIYRHNMSWKMNMVGAGYQQGLSRLCEGYGLMVGY